MPKEDVRRAAARFALPVADKPDSQDICFVPDGNYARVVERLRPGATDPGEIVHIDGRVLGGHQGIIHFTVGQRRRLGIGGTSEPLYVVRIDPDARQVVVGPKSALGRRRVLLNGVNWLGPSEASDTGMDVSVKLRSAQAPVAATVSIKANDEAEVVLATPDQAVAPGQACVFYDGDRLLGGGWIRRDDMESRAA